MKRYKRLFVLLLGLGIFGIVIGVGNLVRIRRNSQPLEIILIQKAIDETNDFWESISEGARMAAKENGAELTIWGPDSEREIERAHQLILEAIESRPDAIVLAPISYEETLKYARMIEEAEIPLILIDSIMEEPAGAGLVATDNVEGGFKMGELMRRHATEDTAIGIVGHVKGSSTAVEREQGLRQGLGEYQDQIVDVVFCDSSFEIAYDITCEMLEKHPEINMIAGLNEYSAVGAAEAVIDMGRADSILMVGFDSSTREIQLLEAGVFEAIVIQKPINIGYLGIEAAAKLARGEKIEENVDSGSVLVTKDTIYTEENEKLLFPFFGRSKEGL
ncbi:MAG: substrate-binding domain-containing protein [Lachnospiraceae bacterium]|jgi:ribose transport system substrate-binding protein|nr:substrate-binding domain-containing protein [Lachnospiraceae bacterium]